MGKRKKAAKPQGKKRNAGLDKTFPCLFCNHENSVSVELDKKAGVGELTCKVCSQKFQCAVNYLSAAVDVYSDWVDACDAVAKEGGEEGGGDFAPSKAPASGRQSGNKARDDEDEDDDNDDDIMADEDGLGNYRRGSVAADDEY